MAPPAKTARKTRPFSATLNPWFPTNTKGIAGNCKKGNHELEKPGAMVRRQEKGSLGGT